MLGCTRCCLFPPHLLGQVVVQVSELHTSLHAHAAAFYSLDLVETCNHQVYVTLVR